MAGVGKSTIGSMVSKQTQVPFYDTDKLISNEYNQPLNHIINDNALFRLGEVLSIHPMWLNKLKMIRYLFIFMMNPQIF